MEVPECGLCYKDPDLTPDGKLTRVEFADYGTAPDCSFSNLIGQNFFCDEHVEAARALSHLNQADAFVKLHEQFGQFERPSKWPEPPAPKKTFWQWLGSWF